MKDDMSEKEDIKELFFKKIEEIAKIDCLREIRAGKPEAVFAEFKEVEEVVKIVRGYLENSGRVLVTRADSRVIDELTEVFDSSDIKIKINRKGRTVILQRIDKIEDTSEKGSVAIITAGTSDIGVAEESASTAEFLGLRVIRFYDVGIAGIHRLIEPLKEISKKDVDTVIAIAGMEGALPSVIAGLIDIPVIAVPTSVGYGTSLNGITTLFAMLQSCSSGVAVVNIDNGFGAAVFASLVSERTKRHKA
jgi:hypothetical protein